jgi:hypothetical protein
MATFAACSPFTVFGTPKEAPCARHGRFLTPSAPSPPHGLRTKSETAPIHHQDISLCGDPSGTAFSRSYESSLGIVCRCFQATPDTQNSEFMMEWRLENGAGMNSDLKMARQRELTLDKHIKSKTTTAPKIHPESTMHSFFRQGSKCSDIDSDRTASAHPRPDTYRAGES